MENVNNPWPELDQFPEGGEPTKGQAALVVIVLIAIVVLFFVL